MINAKVHVICDVSLCLEKRGHHCRVIIRVREDFGDENRRVVNDDFFDIAVDWTRGIGGGEHGNSLCDLPVRWIGLRKEVSVNSLVDALHSLDFGLTVIRKALRDEEIGGSKIGEISFFDEI